MFFSRVRGGGVLLGKSNKGEDRKRKQGEMNGIWQNIEG